MKVCIVSLGCAKNLVDSEKLAGLLSAGNILITDTPEEADMVIVNTCGFIKEAKEEAIDTILDLAERSKKLYVMGCLVERYKETLKEELKEVSAFFGTESWEEIGKSLGIEVNRNWERKISTPISYAYLKISEGCNRLCSFCAIPQIRGRYRSFTLEEIEKELDLFERKGIKEIVIISQDTTYYGKDTRNKVTIYDLLKKLEKRNFIKWIRLLYLYPSDIDEYFIKFISDSEKIVHYFDLPLQHVSDKVLNHMRRGYTKSHIYKIIENIKKYIPNAVIRSSFIVGYPTEDEKDFEELKKFVEDGHFLWVSTFAYSSEENTYAYNQRDLVPEEIKRERQVEILDIQEYITERKLREYIGKEIEIVVDGPSEGTIPAFIGRGFMHAPEIDGCVYIKSIKEVRQGSFIKVIIKDTKGYDMVGVVRE